MHGLQNMFHFERGKHSCKTFTQSSVSILRKALPIVTKSSVLDVSGVIKSLKHVPTWTACSENLIQVPGQR